MKFPLLKIGHTGEAVRLWQSFLNQKKIPLDPESRALDGIFGVGTQRGTRKYQSIAGLPMTGVVDVQTYNQALKDGFEVPSSVLIDEVL